MHANIGCNCNWNDCFHFQMDGSLDDTIWDRRDEEKRQGVNQTVQTVFVLRWEWASRFGSSNAPGMQLEMRNIHSHSSIANLDAWNKLHFFRPQRTSQSYLFLAVSLPRLHPPLLLLAHVTFPLAPNLFCPAALGPLGRLASGSLNPARPFSPFVFPSINCHA